MGCWNCGKVELLQGNCTCKMTCWIMGPEWKDEDIILGVDFLNHYKGCLKFPHWTYFHCPGATQAVEEYGGLS